MSLQDDINKVIDDNKESDMTGDNYAALLFNQGQKSATRETTPSAWDDTTTVNVVYLKYPDGVISKVDQTAKAITYNIDGVWANRASLTYTEWGA